MPRIAVSGPICSGKSTVTQPIVSDFGYEHESLAKPLKQLAAAAILDTVMRDSTVAVLLQRLFNQRPSLGVRALQAYETLRAEHADELETQRDGGKPRVFLQQLGSAFRELDVDVWAKDLIARTSDGRSFVVDDLRYENEARIMRANGWRLVRCQVPLEIRKERIRGLYGSYDESILQHPSETGLDNWTDWDYLIDTSVPFEDQSLEVLRMMEAMF